MTIYAFEPEQRQILAVWATGIGSRATKIADTDPTWREELVAALCQDLTGLSTVAWDTYVHPVSTAPDEQERHHAELERAAFAEVQDALRNPNLPDESGMMLASYIRVTETAHSVGRALHRISDQALTEHVAADLELELDAIDKAERGDLTGRAAQATTLDRADASPLQVEAADALFNQQPLGEPDLLTKVDPAAACVAAAHWLTAAAAVTAELAEISPSEVFAESDNIYACSVEVPETVVAAIDEHDMTPREVIRNLLTAARQTAEGKIPSLDAIIDQIARAQEHVETLPEEQRDEVYEALLPDRTTPLDPQRPTRDLLEHLLDGMRAANALFRSYVDEVEGVPTIDDEPLPHPDGGEWVVPDEDEDEPDTDYSNAWDEAVDRAFIDQVREEAAATRGRLS